MEENREALAAVAERAALCERCPLCKTRTHVVFGKGSPTAKILFVGEAPGENEDLQGLPFVGLAGKLLDHYLAYAGIAEEDYYVANILKCRPPHNRDPLPEEENACMPYLREQVRILKPRILVCLGRIAAMRILAPDFKITRQHGEWFENNGMKIMAVYHPAALLRDPAKKEATLFDFKKIRQEYLRLLGQK